MILERSRFRAYISLKRLTGCPMNSAIEHIGSYIDQQWPGTVTSEGCRYSSFVFKPMWDFPLSQSPFLLNPAPCSLGVVPTLYLCVSVRASVCKYLTKHSTHQLIFIFGGSLPSDPGRKLLFSVIESHMYGESNESHLILNKTRSRTFWSLISHKVSKSYLVKEPG